MNDYKVLGQVAPVATTNTTLYTVPASTQTVVSSVYVCNRGSVIDTFRIAIRPAGAALNVKHYIYFDVPIPVGDTFAATVGFTLDTTDVVTVWAGTTDLSFSIYGTEITP